MKKKLLTFTTLFPNSVQPSHGIFVATRLRKLREFADIDARVVAPVPWFPFSSTRFGDYAKFARVAKSETLHGVTVEHPRYALLPKIGMTTAPLLMALSVYGTVRRLIRDGYDFDLIDAHYFYPDGVAAALLGKWLKKPLVITARGTDLNLIPKYSLPRKQILWAAKRASAMITVCAALREPLVEMGVPESDVTVLRNGVDLELFRPPADRDALRAELGLDRETFLSVGHLIERKGHHLAIELMKQFPEAQLIVVGSGPERDALTALAGRLGVDDRVTFAGSMPQEELRKFYGAVDALILASSREGWANVLLEAMACGTPVVATSIWGTPEVVASDAAGQLAPERTAASLGDALRKLQSDKPARADTRRYAEQFSWDPTSEGLVSLFDAVA